MPMGGGANVLCCCLAGGRPPPAGLFGMLGLCIWPGFIGGCPGKLEGGGGCIWPPPIGGCRFCCAGGALGAGCGRTT